MYLVNHYLDKDIGKEIEGAGDKVQGVASGAGDAIQDVGDKVGDKLEDAGEGIKGLGKGLLGGLFGRGIPEILVPDRDAAPTTNGEESVGAQVGICEGLYGRKPNVVLLDFLDKGVDEVQKGLNGL